MFKLKVTFKQTLNVDGDFYLVSMKGKKGDHDKHAIYFGDDVKSIKKEELQAHGEPVIIEKISPKDLKGMKSDLISRLKKEIARKNSSKLPIILALYE